MFHDPIFKYYYMNQLSLSQLIRYLMLNIWVQLISLLRQPYCILFRYQSITVQSKSSLGSKFTQYGAYCPSSAPSQIMQIILIFSPQLSVIIILRSFHILYFRQSNGIKVFIKSFSYCLHCLHSGITPITHIPPQTIKLFGRGDSVMLL